MTGPGHDATCELSDGRIVEYWEGGDPEGRGVIYHPGTPVTRILGRWGHEAAASAHVRLVSVSRPGYGGSTLSTNAPSLLATGRDTAAVAEAIGLEEYAVFGSSGGGPFAVATAVADPRRVRALGVVGGIGPWRLLDELTDEHSEELEYLAMLDAGDAAGAWAAMYQSAEQEMDSLVPLGVDARVNAFFMHHEGDLTRDDAYRAIWAANLAVIIESPGGYVLDNLAWGGTWDVDPTDVVTPTTLWFGDQDRDCPADTHGRWYHDRIAGSSLVIFHGEGHMDVIDDHWPEVLAGLLDSWA